MVNLCLTAGRVVKRSLFHPPAPRVIIQGMTLRRLITVLLAILIIAGLTIAPLVNPAKALGMKGGGIMGGMHAMSHTDAGPGMQSMADMHAMSDMDSMQATHDMASMPGMEPMAADMPCCPSDKKDDSCPDCPLMAICALKTAQARPSMDGVILLRTAVRTIQSAHSDMFLAGLDHPPPDHPPRHLI